MNSNLDGLQEIHTEPADPVDVDVPTRTCLQQDDFELLDDNNKLVGITHETCGQPLVYERHGDEIQYACVDHGWQATVFEERSGK